MYSLRRWLYKPRRDDTSILAQFFYADEDLNYVAAELDSFDGRKEPERCTQLVNQLRQCQDKVLNICNQIMDEVITDQRANRDFRVKFPDDILQENLAGQLWFGAECLAAGSSIMYREIESASMRPLAKALTKTLDNVRNLLRDQCLRNPNCINDKIRDALRVFDRFFAEFELSYVSAMVPVKTTREYDIQQEVVILFSETLQRALRNGLITQDTVDDYDPALMFTIPRLAIICGLLVYPDGPLNLDLDANEMSEMFRPFRNLLHKIRDLLWSLSEAELTTLEKALCSLEEPGLFQKPNSDSQDESPRPDVDEYVQKVCTDYPSCKQFISDFYEHNLMQVQAEQLADEHLNPWMQECEGGGQEEELSAIQESLSDALTKVIERSGTRDSGLHSDTCSNASDVDDRSDRVSEEAADEVHHLVRELLDAVVATAASAASAANAVPDTVCSKDCAVVASSSFVWNGRPRRRKTFRSYPGSPYACGFRERLDVRHASSENMTYSSSCSSCRSSSSSEWDSDCCSSDTSSYDSNCHDDEEIALAIQAAEIATRNRARSRFRSSEDLVHRLFVCISGVADQLQTNHASDLRNILKYVFQMNCSEIPIPPPPPPAETKTSQLVANMLIDEDRVSEERLSVESAEEADESIYHVQTRDFEDPPAWIPDEHAPECMSCFAAFNVVRRRHHCRNCGEVFCSKCSSNSVPLPHYGHSKPVRVCNRCFMFQVTSILMEEDA